MRSSRKKEVVTISLTDSDGESESENVSSDDNYEPEKVHTTNRKRTKKIVTENDENKRINRKKMSESVANKKHEAANTKDSGEPATKKAKTTAPKKTTQRKIQVDNSSAVTIDDTDDSTDSNSNTVKLLLNKHIDSVECSVWTDVDYVSETYNIDRHIAQNVKKLFNEENTIPFIARYRRNMTGGMEPDKLRALKESFDQVQVIKHRAATILRAIDRLGQWTPDIHTAITSTKSLDDLAHIYSFFKRPAKGSLAERARSLGLGSISQSLLQGQRLPSLVSLINPEKDGLHSEQQIKEGIIHIIAETINKNKSVFDKVKALQDQSVIEIQTTECKTNKSTKEKEKDASKKFGMYYDFNSNVKNIKPHQILAINRAEAQKIISVKITLPNFFVHGFKEHCREQYKNITTASLFHQVIFQDSIEYAYTRYIKPLVIRRIRNELKQRAEAASIEVFATNVKQLLLSAPVRGKIILGIDPGFSHGCKLAVISEQGNVLDTSVIYPHKHSEKSHRDSTATLINLIKKHNCSVLALGNATACRETELFLTELIKSNALNVSYAIVDESGASIYSCGVEAKAEFPNLDPNVISAISIARRLQDPLAELVKVEPKHLGVGMYQHDLPEKQLVTALNEVVSEAVSFVGVDINTASQCLLKRVAGLNESKANNIIEHRTNLGPFMNRKQLLLVKGIGSKTFEQCAGFIRILPETSTTADTQKKRTNNKLSHSYFNLLDQTWIHPESYAIAEKFLKYSKSDLKDLGTPSFIEKMKSHEKDGCAFLAEKFGTDEKTMEIIIKGLSMKKDEDIRLKANSPLFRNSMVTIKDLKVGATLTGAVRNVTHFGAFVDVGVGRDGLIPIKWMKQQTLSIGQRVEVKVLSVEVERNRISLELTQVL